MPDPLRPRPAEVRPRCPSVYAGVWASAAPGLRCDRMEHGGRQWFQRVHQAEVAAAEGLTQRVSWL